MGNYIWRKETSVDGSHAKQKKTEWSEVVCEDDLVLLYLFNDMIFPKLYLDKKKSNFWLAMVEYLKWFGDYAPFSVCNFGHILI